MTVEPAVFVPREQGEQHALPAPARAEPWFYPGILMRVAIPGYLVFDRILNADREREIVITSAADLDGYALFQVATTLALGALVCLDFLRPTAIAFRRLNFQSPLGWLTAYLGLAVLSGGWSGQPLLTVFKAGQCIIFLLAVQAAMAGLPDLGRRIEYGLKVALAYLTASYYTFVTVDMPGLGLTMNSLHFVVGTTPFVPFFFLALLPDVGRIKRLFLPIFSFFILIETIFTVYLALAGAAMLNFLLKRRDFGNVAILVVAGAFFAAVLLLMPSGDEATFLGVKKVGDIATGSGRFEVWSFALRDAFPQNPVLGFGFVVGDTVAREAGFTAALGQLHNSVLSALINLGLVGLILFGGLMVRVYQMIQRHPRPEVSRLFMAALVCIVLQQLSGGASVPSILHPVWIAHAMIFVILAIEELTVTRPTLAAGQ